LLRSRALAGWRGEGRGREGEKLRREGETLTREGEKLRREGETLTREGEKLTREGEKLTVPGRAAAVAQGRRSTRARPRRQCGGALTKTAGSPRPGRARAPGPQGAPIILERSGTFWNVPDYPVRPAHVGFVLGDAHPYGVFPQIRASGAESGARLQEGPAPAARVHASCVAFCAAPCVALCAALCVSN